MRRTAWLLIVLLAVVTACGAPPSASPGRAAPAGPPASRVMSARFGSAVAGAPTSPASVAGGTPIAVAPVTAETGFVLERAFNQSGVGGALLKTADGGVSWTTQPLPPQLVYEGLYASSADSVVVWAETPACVGEGNTCIAEVLRSSDGGRHFTVTLTAKGLAWTASRAYSPAGLWLAASSANCYAGCHPVSALYTSATAGATWTEAASGAAVPDFAALWTTNGTSAYGLTSQSLYQSVDGGQHWTLTANLPTPAGVGGFSAVEATIAVPSPGVLDISACNGSAAAGGGCPISVFQSTDGGHTLRDVLNWGGTQDGVIHLLSPEQGTVIMMGLTAGNPLPGHPQTNIAVATQNGFATTSVSSQIPLYANAVAFRSPQDGWVVGAPSGCFPGPAVDTCPLALATTTNGGVSWSLVGTAPVPTAAVEHPAPHVWWGLGTTSNPSAVLTSTTGNAWHVVGTIPGARSNGGCGTVAVSFPSAGAGYVVDGAALYRTVDGGRKWAPVSAAPKDIYDIWFFSASEGVVLTGCAEPSAVLYATEDGGQHWTQAGRLPSEAFSAVFLSPAVGYAVQHVTARKEVRLVETTDGGATWRPLPLHLPVSSSGLVALPGGTLVVETLESLLVIHSGRVTATVNLLGSVGHGLLLDGVLPIRVTPRLEIFVLGEGLWTSPWQRNMVLQDSAG